MIFSGKELGSADFADLKWVQPLLIAFTPMHRNSSITEEHISVTQPSTIYTSFQTLLILTRDVVNSGGTF